MKTGGKMEKYSKYLTCRLNKLCRLFLFLNLIHSNSYSIDVLPQGKLIRRSNPISQTPTVQMYFDPNRPPVIFVTPGRPTVVQFPSEVRSCISASSLISITYADKTSQSSDAEKSSEAWFSAVIFNTGSIVQTGQISADDLLKIPETAITCQIRIASPDSQLEETYTWQTIGVKISNEKNTHFVVYLLNQNSKNSSKTLPSEEELINIGAKSVNFSDFKNDKINKQKDDLVVAKSMGSNEQNLLDYFSFSEVKKRTK